MAQTLLARLEKTKGVAIVATLDPVLMVSRRGFGKL